jgi:hypothetical protein
VEGRCAAEDAGFFGVVDQRTSFMWTWKMRSLEAVDELDVVHALVAEVAGVVVEAEGGVVIEGFEGALGEAMSKAISVGCTSRANLTPSFWIFVEDGGEALAKSL